MNLPLRVAETIDLINACVPSVGNVADSHKATDGFPVHTLDESLPVLLIPQLVLNLGKRRIVRIERLLILQEFVERDHALH